MLTKGTRTRTDDQRKDRIDPKGPKQRNCSEQLQTHNLPTDPNKITDPYKITDSNKKIKLIIYYNKFKTSNLVIRNNSSLSIGVLQKTNVIYQFKCPLGDCISDKNNIHVGLTSTTLSRRLTMHLSDTSSIAQHLEKNIHAQQQNYGKFSPITQHY